MIKILRKYFSKKSDFPEEINMKRKVIFSSSTIDSVDLNDNPNSTLNIISNYFPKINMIISDQFSNFKKYNNIKIQFEYFEDGRYEK